MYCPQCRMEYREGFDKCSDCRVALVETVPDDPHANRDAVVVFESSDTFAIALAKGTLEDAGIPFWMYGDLTAAQLVLGPIMFPACQFLVPKDREAQARKLLQMLESPRD